MAGSTFLELRSLLKAHGHQYLDDPIAGLFVIQAVDELVADHLWRWRLRETTVGDDVWTIDDVATVDQVVGPDGRPLTEMEYDDISDLRWGQLEQVGAPLNWYLLDELGVKTWPLAPDQNVRVRYYSSYGWTKGGGTFYSRPDSDEYRVIVPKQAEELVILGARQRAKSEAQDHDQAGALRSQYETRLEEEKSKPEQVDEARYVKTTSDDWA